MSSFDIDDDPLSYTVSEGLQITANLSDNNLTFIPDQDFNGTETFIVAVTDGLLEALETFTVTINPDNDAPEF